MPAVRCRKVVGSLRITPAPTMGTAGVVVSFTGTLHGGPGGDRAWGDTGDDRIWGNTGDDRLDGGNATNYINGGDDADNCTRAETDAQCEQRRFWF